jgi:hypothetical protein
VSYMSWNTLSVKLEAGRITVWLNGQEIGSVISDCVAKGRIGMSLWSGGDNAAAELTVSEVQVQPLEKE